MELLEVEKEVICGKKVSVFTIHGDVGPQKYLIGVQVSKILRRQTFNLYRSLKLKGVGVVRATPQQVGFLLRTQSLPPNSHSVSLIPYVGAKDFILENFKGKIEKPLPTASKATQPPTPQQQQQNAAQLQKILQLQRLKRAYEREYAYSSGNESSSSSSFSNAALSSDSEADVYQRRPAPTPAYQSLPLLNPPMDELKRHQRPDQNQGFFAPPPMGSRTEFEAGEVLASFFRRQGGVPTAPGIPTRVPRMTVPVLAPAPVLSPAPVPFPAPTSDPSTGLTGLTLPPISSLPPPAGPPARNPKHDLSFLLA